MLNSIKSNELNQNVNFRANYLKQAKRTINTPFNYLDNKIDARYLTKYDDTWANALKLGYRTLMILGLGTLLNSVIPKEYNEVTIDLKNIKNPLENMNKDSEKQKTLSMQDFYEIKDAKDSK